MHPKALVVAYSAFTAASLGCGVATGASLSPVGTYQLTAVNGQPLPQALLFSEIQSGSANLRADGTYSAQMVTHDQDPITGQVTANTKSESGTYTHQRGSIIFTEDGGFSVHATYDGTTIVIDAVVVTLTYRR